MPNKVFALEGNGSRPSHFGDGYSESDVSYTLNHVEQHGVCYGVDVRNGIINEEMNGTIQAKSNGGWNANSNQVICYGIGGYDSNSWKSSNPHSGVYIAETSRTLDAIQCGNPACNQGGVAIVEEK